MTHTADINLEANLSDRNERGSLGEFLPLTCLASFVFPFSGGPGCRRRNLNPHGRSDPAWTQTDVNEDEHFDDDDEDRVVVGSHSAGN